MICGNIIRCLLWSFSFHGQWLYSVLPLLLFLPIMFPLLVLVNLFFQWWNSVGCMDEAEVSAYCYRSTCFVSTHSAIWKYSAIWNILRHSLQWFQSMFSLSFTGILAVLAVIFYGSTKLDLNKMTSLISAAWKYGLFQCYKAVLVWNRR